MTVRFLVVVGSLLAAAMQVAAGDALTAIDRGEQALRAGQLEAAEAAFQEALTLEPESVNARLRLAGVQVARMEDAAAIENFQKVIGVQPQNARAFIGMGLAFLHQGRYGLARAALQEAVAADASRQGEIAPLLAWIDARADVYSDVAASTAAGR